MEISQILEQMELATQKLKPSAIGNFADAAPVENIELKMFTEAITSNKVANSTDAEIRTELKKVLMLVGIKAEIIKQMQESEKNILVAFLRENFGYFRLNEILLAFKFALAGKLALKTDELSHFNNFNSIYLSKVLQAYKTASNRLYEDNRNLIEKLEIKELPPVQITDEQKLQDCLANFKAAKNPFLFLTPEIYKILVKQNKLVLSEQ
jgi:hypothetical protein